MKRQTRRINVVRFVFSEDGTKVEVGFQLYLNAAGIDSIDAGYVAVTVPVGVNQAATVDAAYHRTKGKIRAKFAERITASAAKPFSEIPPLGEYTPSKR